MDFLIPFLAVLSALVLFHLAKSFLPSYFSEKGKNLATKEDIHEITDKVESIKHSYSLLLEEYRKHENLRFAAVDRRLEAHQQAFTLWWWLVQHLHSQDVIDKVGECQDFWVKNCLYLSAEASKAFRLAYMAAADHESLKQAARHGNHQSRDDVNRNFADVVDAGNVIRAAVELPALNEQELPKPDENAA